MTMEKQLLTLRERQLEYLRILKELDRYCTEKGLCYYIGCGTLIGAVRHKGFIPWDDDLDVYMPEPDFNKFFTGYKSKDYTIHTCWNDKAHQHIFARFNNDNIIPQSIGQYKEGFGIDVYIIYGAPADSDEQNKHMNNVFRFIKIRDVIRRVRNGLARRNLWPSRNLSSKLLNWTIKRTIKEFKKYDYYQCEYVWPFGGGRFNIRKEIFGSPIRLQFEDGFFMAPEHYHEYLTLGYGDYMQLPPEEKRTPYHEACFYRKNKEE